MKQVQRSAGAVAIETAAFAGMAGTVAGLALIILGGFTILGGLIVGGAIFAVIFAVMWVLMQGTLEPPRGPGNIKPTRTPLTRGAATGVATAGKTATPKPATTNATTPSAQKAQPKADPVPAQAKAASDGGTQGTKPAGLDRARDGGADDLKQIKGVGPKLEEALNAEGYYHYDQIAAWNADNVAWIDENLVGFKGRATRDDWVGQAKGLASAASG